MSKLKDLVYTCSDLRGGCFCFHFTASISKHNMLISHFINNTDLSSMPLLSLTLLFSTSCQNCMHLQWVIARGTQKIPRLNYIYYINFTIVILEFDFILWCQYIILRLELFTSPLGFWDEFGIYFREYIFIFISFWNTGTGFIRCK